jgi:hypothetical protein
VSAVASPAAQSPDAGLETVSGSGAIPGESAEPLARVQAAVRTTKSNALSGALVERRNMIEGISPSGEKHRPALLQRSLSHEDAELAVGA